MENQHKLGYKPFSGGFDGELIEQHSAYGTLFVALDMTLTSKPPAMPFVIDEIVLEYQPSDIAAWKSGQRDPWLEGVAPTHVANQPNYHFGEYFVLYHYALSGWHGYRFYALGNWELNSPKLQEGREVLARTFDPGKLVEFRQARESCGRADGKGEPDLFLVHPEYGALFLEVKKGKDRTSPEQLECLAQIHTILKADVGVVYLAEAGIPYQPRQYKL